MNTKLQLWCAWSIVPFILLYVLGFGVISGFIPPQSPAMSSADIYAFYAKNRTNIQIGQLIALTSAGGMLIWPAAVSVQMSRIEQGPFYMLSIMQYVAAAILFVLFIICGIIWSTAAFRTDIDPGMLRMLNDLGWLIFVMAYPEYVVQIGSIAVVGFMDRREEPFLPRWACYVTAGVAAIGSLGGLSTFAITGAFAWNGLIGFWLPIGSFVVWLVFIILPHLLKAIAREAASHARDGQRATVGYAS